MARVPDRSQTEDLKITIDARRIEPIATSLIKAVDRQPAAVAVPDAGRHDEDSEQETEGAVMMHVD
ncbi:MULTISPECIES: hypothetical protein [unclassified Frankia]|uniref:hypothetical protein n=1 Tax=unclassified Frankia TaxID=2632575 RepID=UPI001EF68F92|nr:MULTISPECIES: hypothetical protein [unclassified Frankia]